MFSFKDIEITDKAIFEKYFKYKPYWGSECSFANLFAWRKCYHIRWMEHDNLLFIKVNRNNIDFFLPPFPCEGGDVFAGLKMQLDYIKENPECEIHGIYKDTMESVPQEFWENFELVSDRDNYDYVYSREELSTLAGRKFHSKKNHLNAFKKLYPDYQYLPFTPEIMPQCVDFLRRWFIGKEGTDYSIRCEMSAINQILSNFDILEMRAGCIMIDGQVEAFTYGELLNSDLAVIHIEKANPQIRGLYNAINQEFCKNAWGDVTYLNREEDMGIEGLRKAKESYNPVIMVEKYSAILKR